MAQLKHNRFVMLGSLVATVVAAANGLSFLTLMAGGMTFSSSWLGSNKMLSGAGLKLRRMRLKR